MADVAPELHERFAPHNALLPDDVLYELQSILRLFSISPQELFFKWESYSIKMGSEDTKLDLKTARDFKKDLQEALERETRGKLHMRGSEKKGATPRNARSSGGSDVFGIMDGVASTPRVPMTGVNGNSVKRKNNFETPASKASKPHATSSPLNAKDLDATPLGQGVTFSQRPNAGQVVESLNSHINLPNAQSAPFADARIKLKANTDLSKFSYKTMAMKLSEASEILDDRIDAVLDLVQEGHGLEDGAFGNPANQSTNEIIAVGRIASDSSSEGKLNAASVVLETSRRMGAGLRVPLKLEGVSGYDLFPGKIVALRGNNASGEYFSVAEILDLPLLPPAAAPVHDLDLFKEKLLAGKTDSESPHPLNIIISSGPYTSDADLDFEPLQALCDKARETSADAIILLGPFLDVEHPLIASGDIPPLPASVHINPDTATLTDVFHALVSLPLQRLAQSLPSITIIMVPSVRDAVNKHVAWPQDKMVRKELGLPKQVAMVTNPVMLSLNEFVVAISSQDVLFELRRESCVHGPAVQQNLLARLSKHVIEQRHFFPLFPPAARDNLPKPSVGDAAVEGETDRAVGSVLDISYLALGEWQQVRPDVLITPSALAPFAKVVESVVVINPGTLSKKKGPGTFAQMTVEARKVSDEEREAGEVVGHNMFERSRVDVVRI